MAKLKPKDITKYSDARSKILSGLTKISAPVIQTISPLGSNVIFQDHGGLPNVSNDGFTVAQHIAAEDPIENTIIDLIKHASLRTNNVAGDGTSTTILLADTLIRQGFGLIDNGYNPMNLKRELDKMSEMLSNEIPKYTHKIKDQKDLEYVALVSSNNDKDIARNVATVISKAKEDGMVFIENNPNKTETKIVEELGFMLDQGMFAPQLANQEGRFVARYDNIPVLITDKRLYYEEETISILQRVNELGFNQVVIVASDFIGQAPNILIANHMDKKVPIEILFVKSPSTTAQDDLAAYLGGQVYTEKRGSMVKELKKEDFTICSRVFSDPVKTILSAPLKKSSIADLRIKALRDAISKTDEGSQEFESLKRRIAAMTNGVITIKVGAKTQPEMNEKLYRYEDSINATRNALRNGYVVGGGVTLYNLYKNLTKNQLAKLTPDLRDVLRRYCESSLRQIAINCNKTFNALIDGTGKVVGYNALTDKFEDMLIAGIIEPSTVLQQSIENSISIAGQILSADYMITNIIDKKDNTKEVI